jgi:SAM-dependent methyltransferase
MEFGKYNCDCHQNIEEMTFDNSSFDAVICLEVLEHVINPFQAVKQIKRVLRQGGKILLTVPFLYGYHGKGSRSQSHDSYPDFWRFTHEGLQLLFNDFQTIEITPLDGPIEFRLKQLYCTRFLRMPLFRGIVDAIDPRSIGKATSRHMLFGIK